MVENKLGCVYISRKLKVYGEASGIEIGQVKNAIYFNEKMILPFTRGHEVEATVRFGKRSAKHLLTQVDKKRGKESESRIEEILDKLSSQEIEVRLHEMDIGSNETPKILP